MVKQKGDYKMARITKDPEIRKAEIISVAQELFETNGFQKTSVDQIVKKAEIAKGTFYYYFKSKDDVMEAVMEKLTAALETRLNPILKEKNISATDKIKELFKTMRLYYNENNSVVDELHTLEDADAHNQSIIRTVEKIAPILAAIIEEGVLKGEFKTAHPLALAEIILTCSQFLLDSNLFITTTTQYNNRLEVMINLFEKSLEVPKDAFNVIIEMAIKKD